MTSQSCSTCGNPVVRLLGGVYTACVARAEFAELVRQAGPLPTSALASGESLRPLPPGAPEAVQQLVDELRAEGVEAGGLRQPGQWDADDLIADIENTPHQPMPPGLPRGEDDPRAPLLDVDLTLQQLSAALVQLDVLRRLLTTTRAELAEQRERHLEHRQDLYKALSEGDAWRARAEAAERELAALRPPPAPARPQVAPFCFGCGEEHAGCACPWSGGRS